MDTIENKVHQLQELSRKQKKLNEFKQDIADILGNADIEEKKKIAEKMSTMKYENMDQARNLQFIVPHVVKELYDHEGPKGGFVTPPKKIEPIVEPVVIEPVKKVEPAVVEPVIQPVIEPVVKKEEPEVQPVIKPVAEKKKKVSKRKNFIEKIKPKKEKKETAPEEKNKKFKKFLEKIKIRKSNKEKAPENKNLEKVLEELNNMAGELDEIKKKNNETDEKLKEVQRQKQEIENQMNDNTDEKKE